MLTKNPVPNAQKCWGGVPPPQHFWVTMGVHALGIPRTQKCVRWCLHDKYTSDRERFPLFSVFFRSFLTLFRFVCHASRCRMEASWTGVSAPSHWAETPSWWRRMGKGTGSGTTLHDKEYPENQRDKDSIKRKYLKLYLTKMPTGNPSCPLCARKTKSWKQSYFSEP